jgi:hypothetical protein
MAHDDIDNPFKRALMRIGFLALVANEVIDQGLEDADKLLLLTDSDIKSMCKLIRSDGLVIPFMSQQHLQVMRYWVAKRGRLNEVIDPDLFTLAVAKHYGQLMITEAADKDLDVEVKPPDKFGAQSKWNVFKEGFETYLTSQKGRGNIPLSYVIRKADAFDPNVLYATQHERVLNTVPLFGDDFDEDNGMVYDLLKGLMLAGPAWPWMQQFDRSHKGGDAWKALMDHYKGSNVINCNKEAAYATLRRAEYHGECHNFTFDSYVTMHQQAHQDLARYREAVPESKKVRDLLAGTKDPSAENLLFRPQPTC